MSTDYSQAAKDILDGLSSPTADEAYHATRNYDERHIAAALASLVAASGGGGGSGPFAAWEKVTTFGPADLPADATILDLATFQVGDLFVDLFPHVKVAPDDGDGSTLSLGIGLGGGNPQWIGSDRNYPSSSSITLQIDSTVEDNDARVSGTLTGPQLLSAATVNNGGANNSYLPFIAKQSVVLQALYNCLGSAPTVCDIDIWALIQRAS